MRWEARWGAWGSIRGDPEGDGSEYFHFLIIGFAPIHHLLCPTIALAYCTIPMIAVLAFRTASHS